LSINQTKSTNFFKEKFLQSAASNQIRHLHYISESAEKT
jgi:hypothetical protein